MNLKQLASYLNLSQTTVSRALNGYPEVSEATRRRVVEAARDKRYKPNARARGLATGRAMAIGHVIPLSGEHEIVNPVFGDFIAGAGESYRKAGFDLKLSVVEDGREQELYRRLHATGAVDGVILHGPRLEDARLPLLRELGLPFVVHGRVTHETGDYAWVDVDNFGAFAVATDHLLDLGHRRIALLNGQEHMDFAHRRRAGHADALERRGIVPDPALMHSEEMTEYYGYRVARALLCRDDAPSGFLTSSLITAIGVRRAVHETGRVMGRDISVVTFDDELSYLRNGEDAPLFTAVRSSVRQAGRLSADLVLARILGRNAAAPQHLLKAELVLGPSTGPCRAR